VGPNGGELDDGRAADDSSVFAKKWLSGWPKRLSHSSFSPLPGLGGACSGMDAGDGSSGIDGSGCLRPVHPSGGPDGGELDDGPAADDSSVFAKKWLSGWPKRLSQSSFNPLPRLGGACSGMDTGNSPSEIDGSGCLAPVDPPVGPNSGELDDRRAADHSSVFAKKSLSGWPKRLSHSSFNPLPGRQRALTAARSTTDVRPTSPPCLRKNGFRGGRRA
jgi:hypothetical protein